MRSVARLGLIVVAALGNVAATTHRAVAQDSGFVAWPRELASRAPALADDIAREFGQRPSTIAFDGRDTLRVEFWNPAIWQHDMYSKVFPQSSVPAITDAALNVAAYVWKAFAREAGVRILRVAFVRVVHDKRYLDPSNLVAAQYVNAQLTPEMIEAGRRPSVAISLREGGAWNEETQRSLDSLQYGPEQGRPERVALIKGLEREIGQIGVSITSKGPDTTEVLVQNPSFWWKDDTLQAFPEASLRVVHQAARRVAVYLWEQHGREHGINVIRIKFHREWRALVNNVWLQRPAQEVTVQFTRQQLQTGQLDKVPLRIEHRPGAVSW